MVRPRPPSVVIGPQTTPRIRGAPRPVNELSLDKASAKAMLMPAPTDAARPTRKVSQLLWVANAAANDSAQRRDGPVHQDGGSRLHIMQHEHPLGGRVFRVAHIRRD